MKNKNNETVASMLKDIRVSKGYTQTDIANKLNKPQSYVSKYESSEKQLDFTELVCICEVLEIDLCEFYKNYIGKIK